MQDIASIIDQIKCFFAVVPRLNKVNAVVNAFLFLEAQFGALRLGVAIGNHSRSLTSCDERKLARRFQLPTTYELFEEEFGDSDSDVGQIRMWLTGMSDTELRELGSVTEDPKITSSHILSYLLKVVLSLGLRHALAF